MPDRRRPPSPRLPAGRDEQQGSGDEVDDGVDRAVHEIGHAALLLAGTTDAGVAQSLEHLDEAARALRAVALARLSPPAARRAGDPVSHCHSTRTWSLMKASEPGK
jgi:hypothetical protein